MLGISCPKSMAPALGTTLTIRAVAIDPLGGMSIAEEKLTLTEKYLRGSTDDLEWRMNSEVDKTPRDLRRGRLVNLVGSRFHYIASYVIASASSEAISS